MLVGEGKNLHKFALSIMLESIQRCNIGLLLIDWKKLSFSKNFIPFSYFVSLEKAKLYYSVSKFNFYRSHY